MKKRKPFNYKHPTYLEARSIAFSRSNNICQCCGSLPAQHAHHWMTKYVSEEETKPEHLTALCELCHFIATTVRRTLANSKDKNFAYLMMRQNVSSGGLTSGVESDYSEHDKSKPNAMTDIHSFRDRRTLPARQRVEKDSTPVRPSAFSGKSSSFGLPERIRKNN